MKRLDLAMFHTCDLHIGSCRNVFQYMERATTMCTAILEVIKKHKAKHKILVVAGDLHDGKSPTEEERNLVIWLVIEAIKLGCRVVVINGNHDFVDEYGLTMVDSFHHIKKLCSKDLYITTHRPSVVDIDELGVSFLCVPCQQHLTTKKLRNIIAELRKQAKHDLCYAVVHEALNGSFGADNYKMKTECDTPERIAGVRGIMLGDIHIQQKMGDGVWYAGSPYQTKINEPTKKGILIWTPDSVDPEPVFLKNVPKLLRISDPKKLKQYEGTKHTVKYVGRERVESDAPNITMQPNLEVIECSGEIRTLVEETRHSALIGLREFLKKEGLTEDEALSGYKEAETEVRR